ncbi:TetR/AcrR family transcriptional regulator [Yinghuangia sp. ASG 101]|uniref:TetR/AcrR family transcriptional regulator C-terminal domain-containing protein n=1 Tax=Yinghuangia sp. ASG 101 TaxID=2896848 RepID=UPI001E453BA9|nr:TetR/AcrR family transcriptional regulator C-terminal domain-containing protein [Yinghuangia sp. ASG 101]UGQ14107.1 TetR/AcrR family transcriptional regulator [Yinghuangia sp. ASG 101]
MPQGPQDSTRHPGSPDGPTGDGQPQAASIWQRIDRPAKAPRATLTHASIAAAAVDIADTDGLEAVSMRKLSGHLGVTTMALYRYVAHKEELFELMLDTAYAEYDHPVLPGETWRDVLATHAHQLRAIALRHPWSVELAARRVVTVTPHVMASVERGLAALDNLGLDIDTMAAAQQTVAAYVRGALTDEVGQLQLMERQQWATGDDLRDAYGPPMQWLMDSGRYPVYRRYGQEARHKDDADRRFRLGLDCVLDGIAARLGI